MPELVLIRGLPGSGKTTTAKRDYPNHIHLEADMYHTDLITGEYKFDPKKIQAAHDWCRENCFDCLNGGMDVVVSNTFTTKWELQPYLDMAEDLGAKVTIIVCRGKWESVHNVPKDVLDKMAERWEDI